ncbi:hypothetical protein [Nocardia brasiliensis]|uniref:hypothetical protein n=1 Tax=Nocardia brasiliensis TaxID=37326 RepID=UPI002454AACC|nr:hypothetical protein [Nocardia brasiliensis]
MTQPDGANPSGAHNPSRPGSFLEWQKLTQADIFNKSKAPIVGPTGSYTQAQKDIAATDRNVLPSGAGLWNAYVRNADPTFPRILLTPTVTSTGSSSGSGSHSHSITFSSPPDYQPAGHGNSFTELGFIECSKDRKYSRVTFGTGNSNTAFGIGAMYATVYRMSETTGDLTLVAATGDIKDTISATNREYTLTLPGTYDALKSEVWAVGLLQVTALGQTCKSILARSVWPMTPPPGVRPDALYAYAPTSTTPLASISYSSLTFDARFIPYYALS